MLRKKYLYDLIKSLNVSEKRYLMAKGKKNAYSRMLDFISRIDPYSEDKLKEAFPEFSKSNKLDVKKHYLYYWILKRLSDYHSANYSNHEKISHILILIDRSLITQATSLIPGIKSKIIQSEKYVDLLKLLEIELKIQKYNNEINSLKIMEELIYYSKKYANLQTLESIKYNLRKILDTNMFSRSEADKNKIDTLFKNPIVKRRPETESFLMNYNYNLLYCWKNGSENNWKRAFDFAYQNFKLLNKNQNNISVFPEIAVQIIYLFLNTASITHNPIYKDGIKKLQQIADSQMSKRSRLDTLFTIHLSKMIHFNHNHKNIHDYSFIKDAETFIKNNKENFSPNRFNNFYFDLAKAYFYINDYKKSLELLNYIYHNLYTKAHTIDFYTHSRLLFCLTCYEFEEYDLMITVVKSLTEFMKRNKSYHKFEKCIIKFILKELPNMRKESNDVKVSKFQKLKFEINSIFKSQYERKVLVYFDYNFWIENNIQL